MGGKVIKGKSGIGSISSRDVVASRLVKSSSKVLTKDKLGKVVSGGSSPRVTGPISKKSSSMSIGFDKSPRSNNSGKSNEYKINVSNNTNTTMSGFNPTRLANKKQKLNKLNRMNTIDGGETEVLEIIKKNNQTYEDYDLINECLIKHFFMRSLEKDARNEIIKEMVLSSVNQGAFVFQQGSMGTYFYIVKQGELELYINEGFVTSFKTGDSFGELALLHGAPRSGTVKATKKSQLWCLERKNFRKIVDHINHVNYEENSRFISSIPILANIENDLKSVLASNLIKEYYEQDKYIVKGKIFSKI